MRLLVTGATGFIGRRALRQLAEEGRFELVAASRARPRDLADGVRHESVDLLAPGAAASLVERVRPTHLLHLAWNAQPGKFWTAPDNLDWAVATVTLISAFVAAGGHRAVLAGTCAEYEWAGAGPLLTEDSPIRPATLYGVAKDATRRLVCAAGDALGVQVAWGRVFWLYGPAEAPGRLVSDVARSLVQKRVVETSEGFQERDFIHVDDAAGAFVAALMANWRGPFNIGSGQPVPVRQIVDSLSAAAGRQDLVRFGARPSPAHEPPRLGADIRVLRDEIGFTPRIALAEGLADTFAWWRRKVADEG